MFTVVFYNIRARLLARDGAGKSYAEEIVQKFKKNFGLSGILFL